MKRFLGAFLLVALTADLSAHLLRDGVPDLQFVALAAFVLVVMPTSAALARSERPVPTTADPYGRRLFVAFGVFFVLGVVAFSSTRLVLTGRAEVVARLIGYWALVPVTVRLANRVPVAGERFPEHGRYWGTPWEDRETVEERSDG